MTEQRITSRHDVRVSRQRSARLGDYRIVYNPTNGRLSYDANGSVPGGETHFATLAPHLELSSGDFLVLG
jgi:hypothetical protein